jgi:hypothetical protein
MKVLPLSPRIAERDCCRVLGSVAIGKEVLLSIYWAAPRLQGQEKPGWDNCGALEVFFFFFSQLTCSSPQDKALLLWSEQGFTKGGWICSVDPKMEP